MIAPSFLIAWEHTDCTQRTLGGSWRLRTHTLMTVEVFAQKDRLAFVAVLVFVRILALFHQVVIQGAYLYHLLAFPTGSQHGTLLPIVNINWFAVEVFVIATAEVANLLIFFEIVRNFLRAIIVHCRWILLELGWVWVRLIYTVSYCRCPELTLVSKLFDALLCCRLFYSPSSIWINICLNYFRFLLLMTWIIRCISVGDSWYFSKLLLNLIYLCLSQTCKWTSNIITNVSIKFYYALLSWLTDILQGVRESFWTEWKTLLKLIVINLLIFGQKSGQNLVSTNDQLVWIHCLLSFRGIGTCSASLNNLLNGQIDSKGRMTCHSYNRLLWSLP